MKYVNDFFIASDNESVGKSHCIGQELLYTWIEPLDIR